MIKRLIKIIAQLFVSLMVCCIVWPVVAMQSVKEIQPIASAVSTVSGILFGFVMASVTLLVSAKDNTLVRNTALTGYLPELLGKLHLTMGFLLLACLVFLAVLFLPDSFVFEIGEPGVEYKYSSVFSIVGVFFMINSFFLFFSSWVDFKKFVEHM